MSRYVTGSEYLATLRVPSHIFMVYVAKYLVYHAKLEPIVKIG